MVPATGSPRPVGERHEVAVGCACGVDVVGSLLEFLAQVEHLQFQLAGAGTQCLGVVSAPDAASAQDLLAVSTDESLRALAANLLRDWAENLLGL
jgi:hypothetical protein